MIGLFENPVWWPARRFRSRLSARSDLLGGGHACGDGLLRAPAVEDEEGRTATKSHIKPPSGFIGSPADVVKELFKIVMISRSYLGFMSLRRSNWATQADYLNK